MENDFEVAELGDRDEPFDFGSRISDFGLCEKCSKFFEL